MTSKRTPADVLRDARRAESTRKRDLVFRAVDDMRRDGAEITYAAVARVAHVSAWLVYADGVRDYIAAARENQAADPARAKRNGRLASGASLRTDLELVRQDNRALRSEIDRLKTILRENLGRQLEFESNETLRQRVDELAAANVRYQDENTRLANQVAELVDQVRETEDELAGARTSLRRMIRDHA